MGRLYVEGRLVSSKETQEIFRSYSNANLDPLKDGHENNYRCLKFYSPNTETSNSLSL